MTKTKLLGETGSGRVRPIAGGRRFSSRSSGGALAKQTGIACLDVGCGGGDVTLEMARLVGSSGLALGTHMDKVKMQLAQQEAERKAITNVEFLELDIDRLNYKAEYDLVYARLLLTHLRDPVNDSRW